MLNIGKFKVCGTILFYEGVEHHYLVYKSDGYDGYSLDVESLDDEGNIHTERYACGSISSAIASIEALENGEEI